MWQPHLQEYIVVSGSGLTNIKWLAPPLWSEGSLALAQFSSSPFMLYPLSYLSVSTYIGYHWSGISGMQQSHDIDDLVPPIRVMCGTPSPGCSILNLHIHV